MANNNTLNYHYTTWFTDNDGNKISIQQPNEQHIIANGRVTLKCIPDRFYKLSITGMHEIPYNKPITDITQFKTDYNSQSCLVFFHPSKEGQTVNITYYGMGQIFIDASRIVTKTNDSNEVIQTLDELTEQTNEARNTTVQATTNANSAIAIINSTNTAIKVWEEYNPNKFYRPLNKVSYLGKSYENQVACQGILPSDGTHWLLIADRGKDGFSSLIEKIITVTSNATTNIVHNIPDFNSEVDKIEVLYGEYKVPLEKNVDFSCNANSISIDLLGGLTADTGIKIYFKVYKNLNQDNVNLVNNADQIVKEFKFMVEYNPLTTYKPKNMVFYNGELYGNLQTCTNVLPTDTNYWMKLTRHGNDGWYSFDKTTVTIGSDNTSHIIHNLNYDPTHDMLEVVDADFGSELELTSDYIENADNISIDLVGWTVNTNRKFTFKVYKGVNDATLEQTIQNAIAERTALTTTIANAQQSKTDLQTVIDSADTTTYATKSEIGLIENLGTSDKASVVSAINEHQVRLDLINENLDIEQVNNSLENDSISPDDFTGTDFQKLQAALDYAITNSVAIRLKKMYDITGLGTLLINKAQNYSPNTNRKPLYIFGVGGGIKKNDTGYMFSSTVVDVGDIFFSGVKFESTENVGTVIFDCNKLINIFSDHCYYLNCDTIAEAKTRYAQGLNFDGNIIVGGKGWAIEFDYCWAFNFTKNIVEWRENGIRNSGLITQINHLINISGNTIEGLTGRAISINGTDALTLEKNYLEANTVGYIEIKSACNGAEISNNFFYLLQTQIDANMVSISLPTGSYKSIGNRTNGILYNMISQTTVYSECDSATTIATGTTNYLYVTKSTGGSVGYDATYGVSKRYGFATGLTLRKSVTFNTVGEIQKVDFVFADTIYADDIYSVQAQAVGTSVVTNMPEVMSFYRSGINTLTAYVKNNYSGAISLTLTANVIKLGNLSYYG